MKEFDLLLVMGYFRSATAYLSIVRHMSHEIRIGVLAVDEHPSLRSKTGDAHRQFLHLCTQFGGTVVDLSSPISARLVLVQQFPYSDDFVGRFEKLVSARRRVGFMTLASAGLEPHDRFIGQFGISKVFVPSLRLAEFLIRRRVASDRYQAVEIQEVGLPFGRYPVFPEFSVDWLVAAPTLFSFHSEIEKQRFLGAVLSLLRVIPPDNTVVYKPHNGNARDYFAPRVHYFIAAAIYRLPVFVSFVEVLARHAPPRFKRHVERVVTGALHLQLLRRAKPMREVTPYADISLEAFLPGVRKGVIGGQSNTIWGTLYFGLPFYNCVDAKRRSDDSELQDRSSTNLLDINLEYFGVPYCEGNIELGSRGEEIIVASEREADLLCALKREL